MTVLLRRHAKLESVTWQPLTGVDGQGKPAYANPGTALMANVERGQEVIRLTNGQEVRIEATLWFDYTASLPVLNDKLVLTGLTGIVVMRDEPADSQSGVIDHVEVMIRKA